MEQRHSLLAVRARSFGAAWTGTTSHQEPWRCLYLSIHPSCLPICLSTCLSIFHFSIGDRMHLKKHQAGETPARHSNTWWTYYILFFSASKEMLTALGRGRRQCSQESVPTGVCLCACVYMCTVYVCMCGRSCVHALVCVCIPVCIQKMNDVQISAPIVA